MKYAPILFSTPMVQAILDGTKTQTRRVIAPQPNENGVEFMRHPPCLNWEEIYKEEWCPWKWETIEGEDISKPPKACIGDVFWVRETWQHTKVLNLAWDDENYGYVYKADGQPWEDYDWWKWKPSIHMPKEACRLFLKVTNVRVERLQDISEEEAKHEGIKGIYNIQPKNHNDCWLDYTHGHRGFSNPIASFFSLWESINGRESLESNPWVWVYEFERIDKPKDWP